MKFFLPDHILIQVFTSLAKVRPLKKKQIVLMIQYKRCHPWDIAYSSGSEKPTENHE